MADQCKEIAKKIAELGKGTSEQIKQQKETANAMKDLVKQLNNLVKEQKDQNRVILDEYKEVKRQNQYLRSQNNEQAKDLSKEKRWQVVAWIITSVIAIGAVIVPLIELVHNW